MESYAGQQFVGIDLHRRRSVIVRKDEKGAVLRLGALPEAWIAPPATRELRELVRHRAKLVAICSGV